MAKTTFTFLSGDKKTQIYCVRWTPEPRKVKGILQIAHGMVEYIERYDTFAGYMNSQGILLTGHDHLGHGNSVVSKEDWGYFAQEHGSEILIEDMHTLRTMTLEEYPDIPYFMLGHSMGSFLLRKYLSYHGKGLCGGIIMGTGTQPDKILIFAKALCKTMAKVKGWQYRSNLIHNMAFAGNNNKFKKEKQENSWLSKDADIVKAYLASPQCTFIFTLNGFYNLFDTIWYINQTENIEKIPKRLPLFLVSGEDDPVGGFGSGVKQTYETYEKAGTKDILWKLYAADRHEILNELDKEQVFADIYDWMRQRMPV